MMPIVAPGLRSSRVTRRLFNSGGAVCAPCRKARFKIGVEIGQNRGCQQCGIGEAGATNAALLAAAVLAGFDPDLEVRLAAWRAARTAAVEEVPRDA